MLKPLTSLTAAALALSLASPLQAASQDTQTIKRDELQQLLKAHSDSVPENFNDFLTQVQKETDNDALKSAIDRYLQDDSLKDADFVNVYRLLGLYTRLHYGDEVVELLGEMVAVSTSKQGERPQHENPGIQEFGELIKEKADAFGLDYRNVDNRVFEVELPGSSDEAFGILTHGDTVPAQESWELDDGTTLDPLETTLIDGKIYGRGTEDDKASIAAALYAMKAIHENDVPLKRTIRLMIETTEETGGEGFEYYKEQNEELPAYNIVLDSGYPAVIAENGFGTIDAYFPIQQANGDGPTISDMTGSLATNQISAAASATIEGGDSQALNEKLDAQVEEYVSDNGGDFQVMTEVQDDAVKVTVKGESAHSSKPDDGINPVPRLAGLLAESDIDFQPNQYTAAIHYIDDNYGLDYHGKKLGVEYSHDFMGPLLISPTYLERQDDKLRVAINVRAPKGENSPEELASTIEQKLADYAKQQDVDMQVEVEIGDWMLRDPQGAWLQTLLNIFGDTTGQKAEPISSAGATTAKLLPNAINFGPSMPGEEYTGHTDREFKKQDNLMLDIQMFTEMFARIGNQERLD